MTALVAPNVMETQFSGEYGNASVATGIYSPNNPQVNDTVYLLKLFAGSKINGARIITGANGAGTTMDVGFVNCDGTAGSVGNQLFGGISTAALTSALSATRTFKLLKDAYVVCTFTGAAGAGTSATNFIEVIVNYEYKGNT